MSKVFELPEDIDKIKTVSVKHVFMGEMAEYGFSGDSKGLIRELVV